MLGLRPGIVWLLTVFKITLPFMKVFSDNIKKIIFTFFITGPQLGGAVGLLFFLGDSVCESMAILGFCESLLDCLKQHGSIDGFSSARDTDVLIIGASGLVVILLIVIIGLDWVGRVEIGLLLILIVSQINFIVGTFITPNDDSKSKGFIGFNKTLMEKNIWQQYTFNKDADQNHNFFSVFAVFFPSVIGITLGANLSGDLKNPSNAIPKGTLLAIVITGLSYMTYAVLFAGCSLRYASGIIEEVYYADGTLNNTLKELLNITRTFDDCEGRDCGYGLIPSQQMMEIASAWGPLIYAGCISASLTSAIGSLQSAPRVLQAMGKDKLLPGLHFFAKGSNANNDPVRGYFLVTSIAFVCILVGDLNKVSQLLLAFQFNKIFKVLVLILQSISLNSLLGIYSTAVSVFYTTF